MKFTPFGINLFTFLKLPAAWWCGVRVVRISPKICEIKVSLRWINQNPFNSMYWAVQGMAAELATGVLIMEAAKAFESEVSMLVIKNKANFNKKAKGKLIFTCNPEDKIEKTFNSLLNSKEPQTLSLQARGIDEKGDLVSTFDFEWSLLLK